MKNIFLKVLENIKPNSQENKFFNEVSNKIIKILTKNAKELGIDIETVLGGSASRGTNMKGNHDLDFFIRFNSEKDIDNYYKLLITKSFDGFKIVHGTREYFKGFIEGFKIEFVPSIRYDSPDKATNSADISFFHINYLKKHFLKNPQLKDDVLLLKQFLKANDIYGAESARCGFSGYVCELLIIYFKGFYNLLEYFENAKPKIIIDIEKHYKNPQDIIETFNKNKITGPLLVVDPQLPERNAASCVSSDSFSQFVFKSRLFLRTHNPKLFNIRGLKLELIIERSERRGTKLISFKLKESDDFDILKAKVLRKLGQIEKSLDKEGFKVYSYGVTDDSYAYFEMESIKVSNAKKHFGPYVWCEPNNFTEFINKWNSKGISKPYVFENKLVVDVLRTGDAKDFIKKMIVDYL
ncbi:MAG: CCA tRNA nucleotidyltransferase [Candidatus Nanoarchaeia archaeon]|nr:CCA tRNA nucleotidyltransferase [Candidatus Nanoarchaeia archaeon]